MKNLENDASSNEFAKATLNILKSLSPTSLKVVFRALQEGSKMNLIQCLDMEYDIVTEFMRQHDFYEGIRATLVDKTKDPKWKPSNIEEVNDKDINAYFPKLKKM